MHDLRGPLNTTALLADLAVTIAPSDPKTAAVKLSKVVQELHRLGRMLDHLVATSDSVALELVPVELGAAVAEVCEASRRADDVSVCCTASSAEARVAACPVRLRRMLDLVLERCTAALPEGGVVDFALAPSAPPGARTLVVSATGPRVLATADRTLRLTDGSTPALDWFHVRALARGMRGDLRVERGAGQTFAVCIDLASSP